MRIKQLISQWIQFIMRKCHLLHVSKEEYAALEAEKKKKTSLHYLSSDEADNVDDYRAERERLRQERLEKRQIRLEAQSAREAELGALEEELHALQSAMKNFDRDHIWAFNSGNSGGDFRGNPKYLFVYINYYRPDIFAYWVCPNEDTVALIKSLGFTAILSDTPAAFYAYENTGVCVSEQAKVRIPFHNVKYLNLWHGMGYKLTERSRVDDTDDLRMELCSKYIRNNATYLNNMILAVTCGMQEEQFVKDFRIPRDHFLRIGYARCTYQQKYKKIQTFDHNILERKGLPEDTRIAVYAPTFRNKQGNTFLDAVKDLEKLHGCCERNGILLIFKMHPIMESEVGYLNAKKHYGDRPYFMFWENTDDIYEIMDRVDLLIYDYSSIYSDFLIAGTKHYIRYIYDMDEMIEQGNFESVEEYYGRTSGVICKDYESVLEAIDSLDDTYDEEELDAIYQKQWEYAGEDDFEKTIQTVLDFEIADVTYPTLYSFDIFDTLLSRKGLAPESIFVAVKEKMMESGDFPSYLCNNYPFIRHEAEMSARTYMRRTQQLRDSVKVEITMDQIFEKMREVYGLTEGQTNLLKQWEIEFEIDAVVPLYEQINIVKKLLEEENTVILISDMYLPKEVIQQMLYKADPVLSELTLFLSNEYGVLKTSGLLFFEVYRRTKPFYNFGEWVHYGDNVHADQNRPRRMNIRTRAVKCIEMEPVQEEKAKTIGTYDAYKVAAMEARMCQEFRMAKADFVISFLAPIMVSYVDWAVRDAMAKGFEALYFVSRDGHPLKQIADALIEANGWKIKTKYIYASRRVWRVPSYIDEIDEDFWQFYGGNFNDINTKSKFLKALSIEDETVFYHFFPEIDLDAIDFSDWSEEQPAKTLVPTIRANKDYCNYLLEVAAEQRKLSCAYLKQEVNPDEKSAFVEFYGRGYNQLCHSRLWNYTLGHEVPLYYYYAKSIHPTEGNCIRYNFSVRNMDVLFMESVFANMPYASIESYRCENDRVEPVMEYITCDRVLFDAMELLLPEYAKRYAQLDLKNPTDMDYAQYEFALDYYARNEAEPLIYENIGSLVDGVSMYGRKTSYAKPFTAEDIENFKAGEPRDGETRSVTMSYMRSNPSVQEEYTDLFQRYDGEKLSEGKLLSENQIKKNLNTKREYQECLTRIEAFESKYQKACDDNPVESGILVVSDESKTELLYHIRRELNSQHELSVRYLDVSEMNDGEVAEECAKAKYLIVAGDVTLLSKIEFRKETTSILLRNDVFNLRAQGAVSGSKLYWARQMDILSQSQIVDVVENPGVGQTKSIMEARNLPKSALEPVKGSVVSDVYFDEEYKQEARKLLCEFFPESENKKILLLMPAVKKVGLYNGWIKLPDICKLQQALGNEYVVLIYGEQKNKLLLDTANTKEIDGFSKIIPEEINIRRMVAIADVMVGDYSDTIFEAVLTGKPIFAIEDDYQRMSKSRDVSYDLSQIDLFPILTDTEDLIEQIHHLEAYDYSKFDEFKQKFLGYCDGQSAKRIVDYIVEDYAKGK